MSDRLQLLGNWLLLRYTKLSTCSTILPSTVISGGCAPEPLFGILVFGEEKHRPNIEAQLLKPAGFLRWGVRCRQHRRDQCQWSTVPMSISDFWDMCSSIQLICNGEKDWHKDLSYIWCSLESTGQILAIENLCTCVLVQCLDEDWVTDYTPPSNEGTVKCAGEQCLLSYICAG